MKYTIPRHAGITLCARTRYSSIHEEPVPNNIMNRGAVRIYNLFQELLARRFLISADLSGDNARAERAERFEKWQAKIRAARRQVQAESADPYLLDWR